MTGQIAFIDINKDAFKGTGMIERIKLDNAKQLIFDWLDQDYIHYLKVNKYRMIEIFEESKNILYPHIVLFEGKVITGDMYISKDKHLVSALLINTVIDTSKARNKEKMIIDGQFMDYCKEKVLVKNKHGWHSPIRRN